MGLSPTDRGAFQAFHYESTVRAVQACTGTVSKVLFTAMMPKPSILYTYLLYTEYDGTVHIHTVGIQVGLYMIVAV